MILGVALLSSCIKHEVIPPPKYESKLPVSFKAKIDGASYQIIEDIKGFYSEATQASEIMPTPQASKITYYSSFRSSQKSDIVQIRIGKLLFSANNGNRPEIDDFNEFFKNELTQPVTYKTDADDGVEIFFQDAQGRNWMSAEDSGLFQDFELTSLEEDTDEEGEYMKFVARFNVSLYDNLLDPVLSDTLEIQNAVFQGYFKR